MIREIKKHVRFYLQKRSKWAGNKQMERPLVLAFNYGGNRLCTLTGIKLAEANWDHKKQRVKLGVGRASETNSYLDGLETKLNNIYFEALAQGIKVTNGYLLEHIKSKKEAIKEQSKSFFYHYEEYLNTKKTIIQNGTYRSCTTSMNRFRAFCNQHTKDEITFDDITPKLLSEYNTFLLESGNTNNTIHSHLKRMRQFMSFAKRLGLHQNTSYNEFNVPEKVGEIKFLEMAEVKKLMAVNLESSMENKARSIMLFAIYTGMRYSDIQNLKREDIKEHRFANLDQVYYAAHIRQVKTGNINIVPLLPEAMAIINDYRAEAGNYALPRLALQNVNEEIKNVGKKAGLTAKQKVERFTGTQKEVTYVEKWRLLSTHMGRRTFVTIAASKGLPINIVASITGQNPATTMRHYMGVVSVEKFEELAAKMKF